jgi:hypothetical protein
MNAVEQVGVVSGDSIFAAVADIEARLGEYHAILSSIVDQTSNFLSYLPQSGNYAGNGVNDWWNKVEALNETFHIDPNHNLATEHSPTNLGIGTQIQHLYDNTMSGRGDPLNIDPQSREDNAAIEYDHNRGVAAYMGDAMGVAGRGYLTKSDMAKYFTFEFNRIPKKTPGRLTLEELIGVKARPKS